MIGLFQLVILQIGDLFGSSEWIINWVNTIFEALFYFLKYILFFVLLMIGILTLLKFRRAYSQYKINPYQANADEKVAFRISHLFLGMGYIILSILVVSNAAIYFFIWIFDPLPDRVVIIYINYLGVFNPWAMNGMINIIAMNSVEKLIFYLVALGSFISLLEILVSVWLIITHNRFHIKGAFINLIVGGIIGILTGFTTCLPLLL